MSSLIAVVLPGLGRVWRGAETAFVDIARRTNAEYRCFDCDRLVYIHPIYPEYHHRRQEQYNTISRIGSRIGAARGEDRA